MTDKFENKLREYLDSGFPILYIKSFEEDKVDAAIRRIANNREVVEWNGARGFVDFKNKKPLLKAHCTLEETLDYLDSNEEIDRKIVVLKDVHIYLEDTNIVARLKQLANDIVSKLDGVDCQVELTHIYV